MAKFHINKHGVPAPCRATKGNCPLGGEGEHFDKIEDAQAYADKQNEKENSLLPGMNNGNVDTSPRLDTPEKRHDFKQEATKKMLEAHFDKHMADGFDHVMADEETYGNIELYTSQENQEDEELDWHMFGQDIIGVADYGDADDDDDEAMLRRDRVYDVVSAVDYMNSSNGETEDEVMAEVSEKMSDRFIRDNLKQDESRMYGNVPGEGETMAKLFEYGAKHDKLYRFYNEEGVNAYGPKGRRIAEEEILSRFRKNEASEADINVLDNIDHPKETMRTLEEYYYSPMYEMKGSDARIAKVSQRIKDWAEGQ